LKIKYSPVLAVTIVSVVLFCLLVSVLPFGFMPLIPCLVVSPFLIRDVFRDIKHRREIKKWVKSLDDIEFKL
jgi:hypothetical protein